MKATAIAPSNIAFIKYFGRIDEKLRLPTNGSISMNLSNLLTTTTVEFDRSLKEDEITIDGKRLHLLLQVRNRSDNWRVREHLDRIRKLAKLNDRARVVSVNNFPQSTGLSSSASGFAALTLAGTKAAGLDVSGKELSILARQGSGSACRSIPDGFVYWHTGNTSEASFAESIFPPEYWDIVDVVVILSTKKKKVATTKGQTVIQTSPLFASRMKRIDTKITKLKNYLAEKNFQKFGSLVEEEAEELHEVMRAARPPLNYLFPETKALIAKIKQWRKEGLPIYYTLNTGHNVHLIIEGENKDKLLARLRTTEFGHTAIVNKPAPGARLSEEHLF